MKPADPKVVPLPVRRPNAAQLTVDEALSIHLDTLYAAARMLTSDAAAAEDLVQETALAAFRAWGELRSTDAVKSWLLKILRNTFVDAKRHEARRPPFVDVDVDELLELPVLGAEIEPIFEGRIVSDDVARALDALPLGFREALWLVDVEELTIAEAAEITDTPAGTVASRVHRARRQLREALAGRRKKEDRDA